MSSNKFWLSALAGAVVIFILGYLVYGMLLTDFMKNHSGSATGVMKSSSEFLLGFIILGNLFYGALLAFIFSKGGISSLGGGFVTGAIVGFLTVASTDCINYGTSNVATITAVIVDVIAFAIISGLAGVGVAWVRGMGTAKKAIA